MITPENSREYSESSNLNTTFSEILRLTWEELSRKPFIKHKKTFFASAALGLVGLATTYHEIYHFERGSGTSALIDRFGSEYDRLSLDNRLGFRISNREDCFNEGRKYCVLLIEAPTPKELEAERNAYIDKYGDNANTRSWRSFIAGLFTLPVTGVAALFGSASALFWGLMDKKRMRNENIYRTPEGELTYKS